MLILVALISLLFSPALAISAYWSPVLPTVCGASVPANITRALLACDRLMDKQLANIFEACVYNVHRMPRKHKLDKPKLCYYNKQALQLDRCKMLKYRAQAFSLEQLVEKEQDHTWCLMKIAQPLGWERLCSDSPRDASLLESRQEAVQDCEQQYIEITRPIRECFNETMSRDSTSPVTSLLNWARSKNRNEHMRDMKHKPAACISFQYSKKIWRCLTAKDPEQSLQQRANQYLGCLRSARRTGDPSSPPSLGLAAPPAPAASPPSSNPNRRIGLFTTKTWFKKPKQNSPPTLSQP